MRLFSWIVYVILLPLAPLLVAIVIVSGQAQPSANLEALIGGTELHFIALVMLAITARDMETGRGASVKSSRLQLMRSFVLVATMFVAMAAFAVFLNERVVAFGFAQGRMAAFGVSIIVLASVVSMAAQAMLASVTRPVPPGAKRKRTADY